jgi:hypothetical protein
MAAWTRGDQSLPQRPPRRLFSSGLSIVMVRPQHRGHPSRRHFAGSTLRAALQRVHHTEPRCRDGCDCEVSPWMVRGRAVMRRFLPSASVTPARSCPARFRSIPATQPRQVCCERAAGRRHGKIVGLIAGERIRPRRNIHRRLDQLGRDGSKPAVTLSLGCHRGLAPGCLRDGRRFWQAARAPFLL